MGKIDITDLHLYYGQFHALKGVNLSLPEKEITAFIGPSGCGKSTLLKTLNRMNDHIDNDELAMLRSFPNVIVSPHLAFYVESTVSNMVEKNFIAIDALRKGELSPFEIKL